MAAEMDVGEAIILLWQRQELINTWARALFKFGPVHS